MTSPPSPRNRYWKTKTNTDDDAALEPMTKSKLTAETITDEQIQALRTFSESAGDLAHVAVCNIALFGVNEAGAAFVHSHMLNILIAHGLRLSVNEARTAARAACANALNCYKTAGVDVEREAAPTENDELEDADDQGDNQGDEHDCQEHGDTVHTTRQIMPAPAGLTVALIPFPLKPTRSYTLYPIVCLALVAVTCKRCGGCVYTFVDSMTIDDDCATISTGQLDGYVIPVYPGEDAAKKVQKFLEAEGAE